MSGDAPPVESSTPARTERSGELANLFHQHAAFVWRVLRRLGLSEADAEDGTQEVFLVVKARLGSYEERGTARAWLLAICQNVARVHKRSGRRLHPEEDLSHVPSPGDDPERALQRAEATALVDAFLATLDEEQAMVFYLTEIEGLSGPELSSALGVNVNTIYGRLRLARRRFEDFVTRRALRERVR